MIRNIVYPRFRVTGDFQFQCWVKFRPCQNRQLSRSNPVSRSFQVNDISISVSIVQKLGNQQKPFYVKWYRAPISTANLRLAEK